MIIELMIQLFWYRISSNKNMTKLCDIIQDTARVDTRKIYLCQVTCLNWANRDIYPRKLFGVAGVVGVEDDVES